MFAHFSEGAYLVKLELVFLVGGNFRARSRYLLFDKPSVTKCGTTRIHFRMFPKHEKMVDFMRITVVVSSYVTRMYFYVTCMLIVCTRMSFVCIRMYPYVLVWCFSHDRA